MLNKILIPLIFSFLAYGFWISTDFKEIAAGVSIFLFGMLFLEQGFKAFTGGILERLLKKTTEGVWKSLSFGIVSTSVMQSSSLVSVITISFLSAGLISLASGIGIIFGANIGTTTGAWLIAGLGLKVKISAYAMPMLVFGIILVFQSHKSLKGIGYILAGLGFLFLGIHHMKEGFEAFRSAIDLSVYAIPGLTGLLVFALIGTIATVIMQSSHATLVLIITALAAQQITYENALALAIGANLGTTITAIIGAMGSNVDGRRLAAAHLIFNFITGMIAILLIQQFLLAVNFFSDMLGIADDDYTMKLAVFHTLFNLVGVIIMLPFINKLVQFLMRVFKPKKRQVSEPRHLHESVLEMADTAIRAVQRESQHLFENAFDIIAHVLNFNPGALRGTEPMDELAQMPSKVHEIDIDAFYERKIKHLYSEINRFISRAQELTSSDQNDDLYRLRLANRDTVEAVKAIKHLQKNLVKFLNSKNEDMRVEYLNIRRLLGTLLREVHRIDSSDDRELSLLSLDQLKLTIKKNDALMNKSIDNKIRNNLISAEMATSLMNDYVYTFDAAESLVEMARIIYLTNDSAMNDDDQQILLTQNEIDSLLNDELPGSSK